MNGLLDKLVLFATLSFLLFTESPGISTIVAMLLIVIVISFSYIVGRKEFSLLLCVAYFLLGLYLRECMIFIPLLAYELAYYELYYSMILLLPGLWVIFAEFPSEKACYVLLIASIVIPLLRKTKRLDKLEIEFKFLRDSSTELNELLKTKNQNLIEKQEIEIRYTRLQERNRIAREIHDNVGHMLSRSLLQVGAVLAINKDQKMEPFLIGLKDTLNQAMNSVRESVHDLHEESIDLKTSIQQMIAEFSTYEISFSYDVGEQIEKNVVYCFIATIKEALANIVKHSNATKVIINLYETNQNYQLTIRDNGMASNFSVGQRSDGLGLQNMRDRVEQLQGNVRFQNDDGFQIYLSIPKKDI